MKQPVLIIHGGAGRAFQNKSRSERVRKKIRSILDRAYQRLQETNALGAVAYAVKLLEDDPEFNAGTGSRIQADGHARLSAKLKILFLWRRVFFRKKIVYLQVKARFDSHENWDSNAWIQERKYRFNDGKRAAG